MLQELQTGLGELQGATHALEEGDLELGLQGGDLPADGGLSQAQSACGGGETAFLGRDQEGPDPIPVEGDAAPVHAQMHSIKGAWGNALCLGAGQTGPQLAV